MVAVVISYWWGNFLLCLVNKGNKTVLWLAYGDPYPLRFPIND